MLENNNFDFKKYKTVSFFALSCWILYMIAYLGAKNSSFNYYPGAISLIGQVLCDGIAVTITFFLARDAQGLEQKIMLLFGSSFLCAFIADSIYNIFVNVLAIANISTFLDSLFNIPFLGFLFFQTFAWWEIVKMLFMEKSFKQMRHIYIPIGIFGILIALVFTFGIQWKIHATSMIGLYQIVEIICEIIGFIFAVLCFITAQTWTLKILSTGYLTIITSDFVLRTGFIEKSLIPDNLFEAFWVLGLVIMILGLWGIKLDKTKIQDWLYKSNNMQVQCAAWAFVFCLLIIFVLVAPEDLLISSKMHLVHLEGLAPILVIISIFVLWGSYLFSKKLFKPLQAMESWINKNSFDQNHQNHKAFTEDYGLMEYNKLADFIKKSFSELKHQVEVNATLSLEKIQAENDGQKKLLVEQEQFRNIVGQMLHDVGAPLSTLRMTVDSTIEIPEKKRITLREATNNITDITRHLLNYYSPTNIYAFDNMKKQVVLVSTLLNEAFGDRRYNYKNLPIVFEYNLTGLNAFLYIKVEPSLLKRAVSNIVNNAAEALSDTHGEIKLKLTANEEWVYITILDNGIGMPKELVEKITNNEVVTHGKKDGHGIGLTVVRDMVKANHGRFDIISSTHHKNHGTTINLSFPRVLAPDWSIEEISLATNDILIILDDDFYIHDGWDFRLSNILEKIPTIQVKHFSQGQDVINFVHNLPEMELMRISLLMDYELINQELNGLQIIEKLKIKHSILVTSHYADIKFRNLALQNNVKILPKDLVHVIPINIIQSQLENEYVNVHMVFLDDEKLFTQSLITNYYSNLVTESYSNPFKFLDEVHKYPKNTRIILDQCYYMEGGETYNIDGVTIADKLYKKGFTQLILLSGEEIEVPEYLTLVLKMDQSMLSKLDKI